MTPIRVESEIGTLKKVLLHRPGKELEYLCPDSLSRLLFDDIPYLKAAQAEHDRFAALLRENGVEVCYLEDLAAQTLAGQPELRRAFVDEVISGAGKLAQIYRDALRDYLFSMENEKDLIEKTMSGVTLSELPELHKSRLAELTRGESRFVMDPMPNLYFTRDPFACIGRGVSLNCMYSVTRSRETIYGKYILEHHPDFAGRVPLYYKPGFPTSLEGGDVLNLSKNTLAVGVSQRTQPESVEVLAKNVFSDKESEVDTVLAFDIPNSRAFMHLDTVFTQLDQNRFTVHPSILDLVRIFEITGRGRRELTVREMDDSLETVLEAHLHTGPVSLIRCGGHNYIASEREQWNDGSNTLCIAPGRVVVYDRNYVTNEILAGAGIDVLTIPSAELSRGRGGPRCMSMPLLRDPV
jgi:arginine deiminase